MAAKTPPPNRANRAVRLGEMIGKSLDPALRRRGFASRDLIVNWQAIAPTPYDRIAMPDRLVWPRRDRPDPEGATLHLRCVEGHALAIAHEGPAIAAAINRYFGYLLVSAVRLSPTPFRPDAERERLGAPHLTAQKRQSLEATLARIENPDLRAALAGLGRGVLGRKPR